MRVDAATDAAPVAPAEELRKAAATMRTLAAEATGQPWTYDRRADHIDGSTRPVAYDPGKENGTWIATMSPAVAEPLASWLEFESEQVDRSPGRAPCVLSALEFARLVNGEG